MGTQPAVGEKARRAPRPKADAVTEIQQLGAVGVGKRLAGLGRQQVRDRIGAIDERAPVVAQQLAALAKAERGPRLLRFPCARDRRLDVGAREDLYVGELVEARGIVDRERLALAHPCSGLSAGFGLAGECE